MFADLIDDSRTLLPLALVGQLCEGPLADRNALLYLGKLLQLGPDDFLEDDSHAFSQSCHLLNLRVRILTGLLLHLSQRLAKLGLQVTESAAKTV